MKPFFKSIPVLTGLFLAISVPVKAQTWNLTGNSGTMPTSNFIGTTDSQPLIFKTSNTEWMRMSASGNMRIGSSTTTPGAKLSFNDVNDATYGTGNDGITWYSPAPLNYGIYKTAGSWVSPNYQQLQLNWITGIVLNPGTAYNKSYVDIQGNGLRVSSGNVGIGTSTPNAKLDVNGPIRTSNFPIYLTSANQDHGLGYYGSGNNYLSQAIDGPVLFGWAGGALASPSNIALRWWSSGGVAIGSNTNPNTPVEGNYLLAVNGKIRAKEVKIYTGWADYVFSKDYKLKTLPQVEKYIQQNNHLPGLPSGNEIEKDGLFIGEMQKIQMEKIEELTLYIIELNKRLTKLEEENILLKANKN